ncbi:hypothetical protein [Escherichia coli]|uniref:Uncharacterized protein n=1 Tax=Escherichia coli TaxID=562 RepID=A0A8T5YLA6_ECOLX|nr:hypothetical protein [Escherichia coli]EFA4734663.1 hypothetical protein [Escherichia coli]EFN4309069.1 hypothetical protein [Escherichia coli]KXP26553.1 hypothetical protein AUP75_11060 [Escherichia coli]MBI0592398.1 hypothetical protein [Escherichia coli]MBI0674310.1 hypothetical protein [Escherichia coli]
MEDLNRKISLFLVVAFSFFVCAITKDMYLFNTSDFYRATEGIMNAIPTFDFNLSLNYRILDKIQPFYMSYYKSSFSLIIYIYASVISTITNYFDMRIYSAIFKITYILSLYYLYNTFCKRDRLIGVFLFLFICLPMISSSNISMFTSFYQEQVILISLPLLLIALRSDFKYRLIVCFACYTVISCGKAQFFYMPLIMFAYFVIFERKHLLTNAFLCGFSLCLAILCIMSTSDTTQYNKYHANYFGSYLYMKNNNIDIPSYVDKKCIGIDSWGNEFDFKEGASYTKIGEACRLNNNDENFLNVLSFFVKNPVSLIRLPYDKGVQTQLTEDYFHVFKGLKLIRNADNLTGLLTSAKNFAFEKVRFTVCLIGLIASIILYKAGLSKYIFIISSFGVSQFYISFFGEGYRDLNKHIFPMNFSFDLLLFFVMCYVAGRIVRIVRDRY